MSNAHDLYGLPLERFVPERTALARTLRDEGQREEAAKVAKLPKPSIAAWAVNQLVRTQHSAISDLFDAGDALQSAQADLLAGRSDGAALRQAAERERRAVEGLMERARGLLSSEGHELSQATLDRVADTLHAAALEDEVRGHVQEGCLQKELRHAGLGSAGVTVGSVATAPSKRGVRARSRPNKERQPGGDDRERARQLEAARRTESDTRRAADLAQRKLNKAQERRDLAAAALQEADDELAAARREAEEAERAHNRAQQALDRI